MNPEVRQDRKFWLKSKRNEVNETINKGNIRKAYSEVRILIWREP